jgi:hypothetical protein
MASMAALVRAVGGRTVAPGLRSATQPDCRIGFRGRVPAAPRGLVLANWAVKVGCSLGQAGTRSGPKSRQLGCIIDDGACWERTGCGYGLHVGKAKWAAGEKEREWAGRRELAQKVLGEKLFYFQNLL